MYAVANLKILKGGLISSFLSSSSPYSSSFHLQNEGGAKGGSMVFLGLGGLEPPRPTTASATADGRSPAGRDHGNGQWRQSIYNGERTVMAAATLM